MRRRIDIDLIVAGVLGGLVVLFVLAIYTGALP